MCSAECQGGDLVQEVAKRGLYTPSSGKTGIQLLDQRLSLPEVL